MMRLAPAIFRHRALVVVVGPTAVGKSRMAIRLAQALETEVLTADSRQVYRGMDIGTDKPSVAERAKVPHRLIDLIEPDQPFNVGLYRRLALQEIERVYGLRRLPLVVGGTGLYVRALLRGLWEGPGADWAFRAQMEAEARHHGPTYLYEELVRCDPVLAQRLHLRDQAKIIRALEVHHLLGRPMSDAQQAHAFGDRPFTPLLLGLNRDRAALYRRIEDRVDEQLAKGLVEETRVLLNRGYGRNLGSMKGLGYRQVAGFLQGEYSYDEAVRRLKRDTRHFAKRQLTWFRKEPDITWITIDEREGEDAVTARLLTLIHGFLGSVGDSGSATAASRGGERHPSKVGV
ncbi:MAG: tRNA (adenosine(37)-N6)-dimethylallyltransferase MiaA [Nitrospirales bacterium]